MPYCTDCESAPCKCLIVGPIRKPEAVHHPRHYNDHPSGVECITITEAFNFNTGNAIKYLWRAGLKPSSTDIEDLQKAREYIDFEIGRIIRTSGKVP